MKSEYVAIMCDSSGRCIHVAKVKTLSKQEVAELMNEANRYETEKEEQHKHELDSLENKISENERRIEELEHSIKVILGEVDEESEETPNEEE